MLRVDFVTLFPELVLTAMRHSVLARAEANGLVQYAATNPRDFTHDAHHTVDARPYSGEPGMLLMAPPVHDALLSLGLTPPVQPPTILVLTEPQGRRFTQDTAQRFSQAERIVFLCGHYEGIDHRIAALWQPEVVSLGDFVLTGGEFAALTMADAVVRLLPGALGDPASLSSDSHAEGLLAAPNYTRPSEFAGLLVPEVLRDGHHERAARFRRRQALALTKMHRPDLLCRAPLSKADLDLLYSEARADITTESAPPEGRTDVSTSDSR